MKYIIEKPHSIYELGNRANQEDNIYPKYGEATADDSLFIVCDGMGGHESGEVASSTVCEVMSGYIKDHTDGFNLTEKDFQSALAATYCALDALDSGAEKKMGTTMTFLKFHSQGCLMAHIGDSRIYHIRPSKKEILYKSRDHSLVNDLIDVGELTLEEAKNSRQKNIITRAIQPNQQRRARATVKIVTDIQIGDYFYMCTDGMLEDMEDENIVNIISMDNDDKEKIRILTELTVENKDNHSAYLVCVKDVVKTKDSASSDNAPKEELLEVRVEKRNTPSKTTKVEKVVKRRDVESQKQKPSKKSRKSRLILILVLILIFVASFLVYRYFASGNAPKEVKEEAVEVETKTPVSKPKVVKSVAITIENSSEAESVQAESVQAESVQTEVDTLENDSPVDL